jgi:hypothetical protein
MLTIVPDAGILSAITIRMLQKLSLIHGFEYTTDDEVGELWMAAASAAGLDLGRDFVEKQAIERLVPRIIDRIAVKVGAEVAEKVVGPPDPSHQRRFRRRAELLFCPLVGTPRAETSPRAPSRRPLAATPRPPSGPLQRSPSTSSRSLSFNAVHRYFVSSGCRAFSKNSFCSFRLSLSAFTARSAVTSSLVHSFMSNSPSSFVAAAPSPE